MTEQLKQKLNDSKVLRWSVLALVAFTMLCGYFLTDVMSPLKPILYQRLRVVQCILADVDFRRYYPG